MSSDDARGVERSGTVGGLFVVSAPSGAGKTTLVEELVRRVPGLVRSRSYTSRPPRPGEVRGVDYNFVSREAFEAMVARGEFLEWATVFGDLKGTSRLDTDRLLAEGHDVVLVIDVQGARQIRHHGLPHVSIFVLPPSLAVLETRLRGRQQDTEEAMRRRLNTAREELAAYQGYDYLVVNDDFDDALARLQAIVVAERCRRDRMGRAVDAIIATFDDQTN
jgi:guanylate kinase